MCFQSGSSCCSVGAGGGAEHPGTGSWLCLKMFFLEAGSYVLPRRNENKAPKSSPGVRWELRWAVPSCCSELGPAWEEIETWPQPRARGVQAERAWRGTVCGRAGTRVLPPVQGAPRWPLPSLGSSARSALLAGPSVLLNLQRGPGARGEGPGKPRVQILALI